MKILEIEKHQNGCFITFLNGFLVNITKTKTHRLVSIRDKNKVIVKMQRLDITADFKEIENFINQYV